MTRKQRLTAAQLTAAAVMTAALPWLPCGANVRLALCAAVYLFVGGGILKRAAWGCTHARMMDENVLMAVASLGAFVLAAVNGSGECYEAVAVMMFYRVGEFFQGYAVGKSREDIAALMDLGAPQAHMMCNGRMMEVPTEEVPAGSTIVVRPGERIPIDGVVSRGESTLDTSPLTGEAVPREVATGDEVTSGCINLTGVLTVKTTKEPEDSTVAKIMEMMEESAARKAKPEAFISKFARHYTPAVCVAAVAVAAVPTLWQVACGGAWGEVVPVWLYRALVMLVVS